MTFEDLFPNLAHWAESDGEIQMGSTGNLGHLVSCIDEGGVVYESPADVTDLQEALELAEAAIGEWLDENGGD
ncbi:hypothetical protein [Fibrella aquatilis]|uniref:Uncharacterized protein n=1 Tax=Fibrella aquatilis TaxID=2817059 RepID=A0A939G4A3_9BACT|nr:hypothetical protein [Fibrella aquatilis]MBO0932097.1 hypothetical protein [Fibrella aquatilis]